MQLAQAIPAIWVYTTGGAFNAPRSGGYGGFLTAAQQARLERIRQARLLFEGKHRAYFLDEGRTQFDFPAVRVASGRDVQMYLTFNVLKLISLKGADLLFGQEPLLRVDDAIQQDKLADLAERTNLHRRLYDAAVECSYEGETFLEACAVGGQVYLRRVPADEIFPVGELSPDGQYERYVRYSVRNAGSEEPGGEVWLLLEQTYLPGSIERRLWQLDREGKRERELKLDQWGDSATQQSARTARSALEPLTRTGIARNTVTWVPNGTHQDKPVSDYDGLIELQDELNAKQSQIGRVLHKHSDPRIAFPSRMADAAGNVPTGHDATFFDDPNEVPKYITWNAELAHAIEDRKFTLSGLLILAETSPGLLGLKEGAAPDAARKLRLEATNSLAKAQRKATTWKAGIRRALGVCQDLEQTLPGNRYDVWPVGVEVRDGIPVDEADQANTIATLVGAGAMSIERAVETQLVDPAARAKEMAALAADREAKMPSVLLGGGATGAEPGEAPPLAAGSEDVNPAASGGASREGVAA